jgi:hypothetical protein
MLTYASTFAGIGGFDLSVLGKFPNDSVAITFDDSPYGVQLLEDIKKHWPAEDGPRNDDWIHEAHASERPRYGNESMCPPDTGIGMAGR